MGGSERGHSTPRPTPEALLDVAAEAARDAGALLAERFEGGREHALRAKTSPTDVVSEADLAAEQVIRAVLGRRRPDDGFLGEEAGATVAGSSGLRWIVDPLDGTVNFLFRIPQWAVSVAVEDEGGSLAGVVFDPLRDEIFAGVRGGPATLNGEPIAGSSRGDLATALVATGFAYQASVRAGQAAVLVSLLPRVRDIRRAGSATLDLAWTAAGRHDAFYERAIYPWDLAAGALICASAGLQVLSLAADEHQPAGILVAPATLAPALLALVS